MKKMFAIILILTICQANYLKFESLEINTIEYSIDESLHAYTEIKGKIALKSDSDEYVNSNMTVSLGLYFAYTLEGSDIRINLDNGQGTFNLKLKCGFFLNSFAAWGLGVDLIYSDFFLTFEDNCNSVSISSNKNNKINPYDESDLTAEFYSCTNYCNVDLYEMKEENILGTTHADQTNGIFTTSLSFSSPGYKIIFAIFENYYSNYFVFSVRGYLSLSFPNGQPTNAEKYFSILVNICNFLDPFDIALDGSFKISIEVDDNSRLRKLHDDISFTGTDEIWSENGVVIFENLKFTEPGDYKLYVKNEFIEHSEVFKLDINEREYVTLIIVSSDIIFIAAQKILNVTVYLYSNDQLYVDYDVEITLMADGIDFQGNYKIITVNGIAVFSIYFEKLGQSILSAKTNEDIEGVIVTSLTVSSIDELCESFDADWNCLQCIAIADFVDGHCKCVENSYHDEPYCKCYDGYTGDNGVSCEPCQNYFSNKELLSYYKDNYREIVISFGDVVQNPEPNCSIVLNMPEFYMKYLYQCIWVDSKTFLLIFSETLPNRSFVIYLKSDLKPMNNLCHLPQIELFVQVDPSYPYPSVNEHIIAPSSISLSCIETNPIIKYSSFNTIYNYTWSAESSNQELNSYIAQQNSYSFELPINYLIQETLYINSNIYYNYLNDLSFSTKFSIEVTYSKIISVIIDLGNYIEVKSSNLLTLKAKIISTCNAIGEYQYEWSYNTINNQNLDEYINKSQRSDAIIIPPNVLVPGYETSFTVTVKVEDLYGSSTIIVYAKEEPLVLKFNRWDGKIGVDNDLEIIASAKDPSHIDAVISISWSCTEGLSYCIGNDGNILLDFYFDFILIIAKEKLRNGAIYLFEATVSTGIKSAISGIEIVIDKDLKGMIVVDSLDDVIRNDMPYNLISKVVPFEESSFHWAFDPSPVDVRIINMDQSFLSIPQNFLEPGVKYKISLTMKSSNVPDLVTSSFIMRSDLPTCEYLSIFHENSKYTLESANCASSQGTLFYQFGYKIQEKIFWITPKSFISYVSLNIRSDISAITMKVCDDYECSTYENLLLTRFQRRHLSIIDDFNNDILTSDDIPPAVIYYIVQADNQETFDTIIYAMGNYFLTEPIDINALDLFISCLSAVQENSYYINTNITYYLKSITIGVLEKYSGSLSNDQVEAFAGFFAPFIDRFEYSELYELSTLIRTMWFKNQLPGQSTLNVSGSFMLYGKRVFSYELPGLDAELLGSEISISSGFEIDETAVFDISFAQFKLDDDSFDIMIYESGSFQNYSLVLKSPSKIYSEFDQNTILIKLFDDYDPGSLYICEVYKSLNSSDNSKCEITSISESSITITINHLSSFKIVKLHDSSEIGRGPVIAMGSIIILFISLIIFFLIVDYKIDSSPSFNSYLILNPYTTLAFMQKNYRRVIISYQLLCNFLLLFFLIGVFQMKTQSPYKQPDEDHGVYNKGAIYSGLYGWAISQGFIFPYFIYNCIIEKSRVGVAIQILLITSTIGVSIYEILYMTLSYYSEYTLYWVINIGIFIPIQVLIDAGYAAALKWILYMGNNNDKDEITERSSIEKGKQIFEEGKDDCRA